MNFKTFDEFWSVFLQVTFHLENPDRWISRERKANWFEQVSKKTSGAVLNLGCGDGLLDIWLSRKGFNVTAVDRAAAVLELAKKEDDTKRVKFLAQDLRHTRFGDQTFDSVLFLESCGLVTREDDLKLYQNIYRWLKAGGQFIVDCPEFSKDFDESWEKSFPSGTVHCKTSFTLDSRLHRIEFSFKTPNGDVFGLLDPIRDQLSGISRYIYPKHELRELMESAGFTVTEVAHYYPKNYFAFVGSKKSF